jgi:hypothetical protein
MRYFIYTGIVPGLYSKYDPKTNTVSNFIYFYTVLLKNRSRLLLNVLGRILDDKGRLLYLKVEMIVPNSDNIIGYLSMYSVSNIQIEDLEYELFDGRFNQIEEDAHNYS